VVKKIIFILEVLIVGVYAGAVMLVPADVIHTSLPFATTIATFLVIFSILLAIIGAIRSQSTILSAAWVIALSLTAFLAVEVELQQAVPPLALIVIMTTGFLGKRYLWIVSVLIFLIGVPVKTTLLLMLQQVQILPDMLVTPMLLNHTSYVYMFCAGLFTALFRHVHNRQQLVKPAVLPPQLLNEGGRSPAGTVPESVGTETISIDFNTVAAALGVGDLLSSVVYFMSRNFKAFTAVGFIYDAAQQAFILNSVQSKSLHIKKDAVIPLGVGMIGRLGTEKRAFMTGDLRVYNSDLAYYTEEEQINSILAVPIIADDVVLGALTIDNRDKQAFRDQDKEIMRRFATLAAALIKSEKMRFEQEKTARISELFYQASHQYTTALKVEEVFGVLFSVIPGVIPCSRQIFIEFDGDNNTGRVVAVSGQCYNDEIPEGYEFPVSAGGLYSFAFQKRKSLVIADYQQYIGRYYRFVPDETAGSSIHSLAIFPIMDDEQRCRGLFSVESDEQQIITEDVEQILTTLVENASVAFVRAMLYQKMEKLATTDGLTGLNNHRTFQEALAQEIERSRRYSRPLSLLLMDIDHFKTFNDTYGHPVGDLVLKEIASCIRRSIRINDIPARYGGEEFVVIIPETNERGALITAERIRSTIEQHTIISLGRELKVNVSIGCSAFPENAPSQQALIDTADKALYAAKKAGRNRVIPYKNGM